MATKPHHVDFLRSQKWEWRQHLQPLSNFGVNITYLFISSTKWFTQFTVAYFISLQDSEIQNFHTGNETDGKKKNMAGMLDVINKILNKKIQDNGQVVASD